MKSAKRRTALNLNGAATKKRGVRPPVYELCLFIAGTTPRSADAISTVVALCEERLEGRYDLVVVDVYKDPAKARADQIIAIPTLLRRSPQPTRRLVGDLSDRRKVLAGLELPPDSLSAPRSNEEA